MKKLFIVYLLFITTISLQAQQITIVIDNATLHIGDGSVIEKGTVIFKNGKIEYAGPQKDHGFDDNTASIIDGTGKHVYPGIIATGSGLGLIEYSAVRATRDAYEVGVFNPNVRSLIAYNTNSKVIPTVRSNGILIAQVVPGGGVISGQSSIMKLSGWNWEDAAVDTDNGMHMYWPGVYSYNYEKGTYEVSSSYAEEVNEINTFMQEAKAYCSVENHKEKNLKFEAMRELFAGKQKMFVSANAAKAIVGAVDFAKTFGIKIVIVGGRQSYRVTTLLKENNIPVIIKSTHELPAYDGDPVDLPYRLPGILKSAGILCGLTLSDGGDSFWGMRNIPFIAGTSAAYGLTKEEALQLITLNNAKILGIDNNYGSLVAGKSATLFVAEGDVLDMKTSVLTNIFINGERIKVENWQDDLSKKYEMKYGIEVK
ncbi:MAG: amidohydrolase family protein [Chitinophagaceae bacterium]